MYMTMLIGFLFDYVFFFFQAEDGIRDLTVTGVQTCALPISAAPPRGRRILWPAVIVTALVGLVVSGGSDSRGRLWPSAKAGGIRSLAVLPLANFARDTAQSWYGDGLTEALTTDLGRIKALRVASRGAVARYRGTTQRLRDVVRDLGVDAVVEGGMQVSENRVRVDVQLIDATSGYQLWADRFEKPVENRFALEDRLARGIVAALGLSLTAAEQQRLRTPPTNNLAAYD